MDKSIYLFIYLLFTVSCVHPDIPSNITGGYGVTDVSIINSVLDTPTKNKSEESETTDTDTYAPYVCLMDKSEEFVGTVERGGNNRDFTNKELKQMLEDAGWSPGLAWCSFMVKGLLDHCDVPNNVTGWSPTSYNKKDVIYTNGRFKQTYEEDDVLVMSLSYERFKGDRKRYKGIGHTGLIKTVREKNAIIYEGNTNDAGGREGDGFHKKVRPLTKNLHITRYGIKN
jgi:hypothetical protein